MSTRERILDTALRLFNEQGTAAASTNHIAAACGISPGNLYYHFRNKEDIIRALFERMFALWGRSSVLPGDRPLTLADLERYVQGTFALVADYAFVYRELVPLLRRDEQLRRRWVEVRTQGFASFRVLIDRFVAAGVLRRPDDPDDVTRLAELCWLVSEFWPASVEVSGHQLDAERIARGVALRMQVFRPLLVDPP